MINTLFYRPEETLERKLKKPPEVVLPLRNLTVRSGQLVKLTCRMPATPRGRVNWYKDGDLIKPEGRFELLASKHGAYRLVIHQAMLSDTGRYSIVVQNKYGSAQSACDLIVMGKIAFTSWNLAHMLAKNFRMEANRAILRA